MQYSLIRRRNLLGALGGLTLAGLVRPATAADAKHYSFGYDQPHSTGYGIAGDTFAATLAERSRGTMAIDQFPGAQLGQEPPTPPRSRRSRA
jgi:TRAP-type C4-dicarboxylate transport system substrate-binding protein